MRQLKEIVGWDDTKERDFMILEQQQQSLGWIRTSLRSVIDR